MSLMLAPTSHYYLIIIMGSTEPRSVLAFLCTCGVKQLAKVHSPTPAPVRGLLRVFPEGIQLFSGLFLATVHTGKLITEHHDINPRASSGVRPLSIGAALWTQQISAEGTWTLLADRDADSQSIFSVSDLCGCGFCRGWFTLPQDKDGTKR